MNETTAVNWTVYRVRKESCGEPDEVFGYYSTRAKAEMEALKHASDPMCSHESITIDEITVES